jgi:hypothetical protein
MCSPILNYVTVIVNVRYVYVCYTHRLSINRPIKCGKEKSPSDGHCHCEKEMDDHLVACQ